MEQDDIATSLELLHFNKWPNVVLLQKRNQTVRITVVFVSGIRFIELESLIDEIVKRWGDWRYDGIGGDDGWKCVR